MTTEKSQSGRAAWRPPMPRKGKAMILDAREMSSEYGWTDEPVAVVHAARDAGWTLQEIGEVLGCTREFVRQLYERDVDPAAEVVGFPQKPKRPKAPKPVPVRIQRYGLATSDEIEELLELQKVAKWRRRGGDPELAAAAEEFWRRVDHLVSIGVYPTWLSKQMGLSPSTLKAGLARYGYRPIPPSQPQRRTGSGDPS